MNQKIKLPFKAILTGGLLAGIIACSSPTDQEYLDHAIQLLSADDTKAATIELQNALVTNPANSRARQLLGETYLETGQLEAAEKELRKAQELGAPASEVQPQLGRLLFQLGRYQDIVGEFGFLDESLDDAAVDAVQGVLGRAYVLQGEYGKAAVTLESVLARSPDALDAMLGQAALLASQGDLEPAKQLAHRLTTLYPESVEAWSYTGSIEQIGGNLEESLAAFDRAIELSAYPRPDHVLRARLRLRMGDVEGALEDALFILDNGYGNYPLANLVAGSAYLRTKNYPEAETYLARTVQLAPGDLQAKILLASAYIAQDKAEQAQRISEQIYATAPDYPVSARLLGAAYAGENRYAEAKAILEKSLESNPDNAELSRMLGILSLSTGEPEEAVGYFDRVLALDESAVGVTEPRLLAKFAAGQSIEAEFQQANINTPDGFKVYLLYGASLMKQGDFEDALQIFRKLQEAQPRNPEPLNLIAGCYIAKQDWDNAKLNLRKVLELEPAHVSATHTLAHMELLHGDPAITESILRNYLAMEGAEPLPRTYLLLSDVKLKAGDSEAAIQALTDGLEKFPEDPSLTLAMARNLFRMNRFADVGALLQNVSQAQGAAEPGLWELQGKTAVLMGNRALAEQAFKHWLDVEPENPRALNFYADSLQRNNRPQEALEYFARAIELDENYLEPRIGEVNTLILIRDAEGARKSLERITGRFKTTPDILWVQGRLAMIEGDYAGAELLLAQAEGQTKSSQLTLDLARAQWQQEKKDEAVQTLKNRIAQEPSDIETRLELASVYLNSGAKDEAIAAYKEILGISPNQVLALNNLAGLLSETDPKAAVEFAERAYEHAPANPYVKDTLGSLLVEAGSEENMRRGLELIREATVAQPESADFGLNLAEAMAKAGQNSQAKAEVDRVLALQPGPELVSRAQALLNTL